MRAYAVILAGGIGNRMGLDEPKQFARVGGRSILEHSVRAFAERGDIDEVVVTAPHGWQESVSREINGIGAAAGPATAPIRVVAGGATRGQSSQRALNALPSLDDLPGGDAKILIHDAARPFVSRQIIDACLAALDNATAVTVGIPAADTVMAVDEARHVAKILDRGTLRLAQTPQGFRLSLIRDAYARAATHGELNATDDAGVVLAYRPNATIVCVPGSPDNIKITQHADLVVAEELYRQRG